MVAVCILLKAHEKRRELLFIMKMAVSFVETPKCVKPCVHADSAVMEDESQHQINLSVTDYSHDATRQNTKIDTLGFIEKKYATESNNILTSFISQGF